MSETSNKLGTTAFNRPHQPAIRYSAKGYDEFREVLLERLKTRGFVVRDDDFMKTFVDLTAYLGEVLMTYQNAYSQEIYLETSQQRESIFSHAALVDYSISPGSAATGKLVVEAKKDKSGLLPKGFPVSGKPDGAKESVFFETDAALQIDSLYNLNYLSDSERFNVIVITDSLIIPGKIVVKPGQYIYSGKADQSAYIFAQLQSAIPEEGTEYSKVNLDNIFKSGTIIAGSDSIFTISDGEKRLLKLSQKNLWLDAKYDKISKDAPVILMKSGARFYGIVESVSTDMLTVKTGIVKWISDKDAGAGERLSFPAYKIRVVEGGTTTDKLFYPLEKDITEMKEVSKLTVKWLSVPPDYGANDNPVTKSNEHIIYAGTQSLLAVKTENDNLSTLDGESELVLKGDFRAFEKYRQLLLCETIDDIEIIEEVSVLDGKYSLNKDETTITLQDSISNKFTKYGVKIYGNVVSITQGKTLPAATLGSARGKEPYQSFDLPKSPLTFVQRGTEGLTGCIDLRINDLPWKQKKDFHESGPEDNHYIIETCFDGKSKVIFGDGCNGNRPPTGKDNVIASYRTGLGAAGNVPPLTLKKPVSKPPFLQGVHNPAATSGGTDADREEQLRQKIPSEHITLDRVVSLQDYADQALAYKGIGKAKAGLVWISGRQFIKLAVAGDDGADISDSIQDLRDYLDARRDINQPLLITPVKVIRVQIDLSVKISSEFDIEHVRDAIKAALGRGVNQDGTLQFFNFDRLDIGMSIHKKDIYPIIDNIAGVEIVKSLSISKSTKQYRKVSHVFGIKPDYRKEYDCMKKKPAQIEELFRKKSSCDGDIRIGSWELAELDKASCTFDVSYSEINTECERSGG